MQTNMTEFNYPSADGVTSVYGVKYESDIKKPIGILQIAHGMAEHIGRYDAFARAMVDYGFVVCGNDHLGHGLTSAPENYGFFAETDGDEKVVEDMVSLTKRISAQYPTLPVFLLGHSMGSIFARVYAAHHGDLLNGVIFMGMPGPNNAADAGVKLTSAMGAIRGAKSHSRLADSMSTGAYNKAIKNPRTPFDWLSVNPDNVDRYIEDPMCGFPFTVGGYRDMLKALAFATSPQWAAELPKELPVLMVSGAEDPVGDFSKGVQAMYDLAKEAGVKDVTLKLYKGARHEILNDFCAGEVTADIGNWLGKYADSKFACICQGRDKNRSDQCSHCSF